MHSGSQRLWGSTPNQTIDKLYCRARNRGRWGQLWAALTGRSCRLLTLDEIRATCAICDNRDVGIQNVTICQIRGSESRGGDFDRDFNPLRDHNQGRWQRIAAARQLGKALPPVDLIQVGNLYFVRDGHHRISVAQALGQQEIEAKVVVWRVSGPLPWETQTTNGNRSSQGTEMSGRVRLQERLLSSIQDLLMVVELKLRVRIGRA
jgi:hypothetical protein